MFVKGRTGDLGSMIGIAQRHGEAGIGSLAEWIGGLINIELTST